MDKIPHIYLVEWPSPFYAGVREVRAFVSREEAEEMQCKLKVGGTLQRHIKFITICQVNLAYPKQVNSPRSDRDA